MMMMMMMSVHLATVIYIVCSLVFSSLLVDSFKWNWNCPWFFSDLLQKEIGHQYHSMYVWICKWFGKNGNQTEKKYFSSNLVFELPICVFEKYGILYVFVILSFFLLSVRKPKEKRKRNERTKWTNEGKENNIYI